MNNFIGEFEGRFYKEARPQLYFSGVVTFILNGREIIELDFENQKDYKEALNIIYRNFDFSYRVEFESLEEVKKYFN